MTQHETIYDFQFNATLTPNDDYLAVVLLHFVQVLIFQIDSQLCLLSFTRSIQCSFWDTLCFVEGPMR